MKNAESKTRRPTVSFIVTCYNHADILKVSLESMLAQKTPPDEIIVADDGSTDETFEVTRALRRQTSIPLIHVWSKDEGFRLNHSRNNALAVATGAYVVVSDGDCFFGPNFIEDHVDAARPGQMVGGKRIQVQADRRDYILRTGNRRITFFTPGVSRRRYTIRSRVLSKLTSQTRTAVSFPSTWEGYLKVVGANMAFWRADAVKVNGFDERYVGWGYDDVDFIVRLMRSGVDWRCVRFGAVVYHFAHDSRASECLEARERCLDACRRPDFRIPDEFGLARALAEGPERIER